MPKLKTSKSAVKRIVKATKSGKLIRRCASAQHRTKGKSKRTLLASTKTTAVTKSDSYKLEKMIPYINK